MADLRGVDDHLVIGGHVLDEVRGSRPLEGAPAAAPRPIAVHQHVVQVHDQRLNVPAGPQPWHPGFAGSWDRVGKAQGAYGAGACSRVETRELPQLRMQVRKQAV